MGIGNKMKTERLEGLYAGFVIGARERVEHLVKAHDYLASAFVKGKGGRDDLAEMDVSKALRLFWVRVKDSYDSARTLEMMRLCDDLVESERDRLHGLEGELVGYIAIGTVESSKNLRKEEGERASPVRYDLPRDIRLRKAA